MGHDLGSEPESHGTGPHLALARSATGAALQSNTPQPSRQSQSSPRGCTCATARCDDGTEGNALMASVRRCTPGSKSRLGSPVAPAIPSDPAARRLRRPLVARSTCLPRSARDAAGHRRALLPRSADRRAERSGACPRDRSCQGWDRYFYRGMPTRSRVGHNHPHPEGRTCTAPRRKPRRIDSG
jgi:hypothetical protein